MRECPDWDCDAPPSEEGRFCGHCQDYEGNCEEDHCATCGRLT